MSTMNSNPARTLLLFDIDGTLLASGGAGVRALSAAVNEHFGTEEGLQEIEIAGRTDSGIARAVLRRFGAIDSDAASSALLACYLGHLERLLPAIQGRLLPGVLPLLQALHARNEFLLGLLTGNLARGAELKLRQYGLWHFFSFGAYADDHHNRNELGRFASARAQEKHGAAIPPNRTFVIGDTPHDIACGRAFGARTVAVATGVHTHSELAAHQPDFLFDDLSDMPAVLKAFRS